MGVLVVLKFRFAKVIALAVSIGNNLRPIVAKIFGPALSFVIPKEYHQVCVCLALVAILGTLFLALCFVFFFFSARQSQGAALFLLLENADSPARCGSASGSIFVSGLSLPPLSEMRVGPLNAHPR